LYVALCEGGLSATVCDCSPKLLYRNLAERDLELPELPSKGGGEDRISKAPANNATVDIVPSVTTFWLNAVPSVKIVHGI
jgi:hypothetical protein